MNQSANIHSSAGRNYGLDLLRLVAAFYVVFIHTMTLGGLYDATALYSYQDLVCRAGMIVAFCCVNIFGIISGYVGYCETPKKHAYSSVFPLWLTVVFYSLLYAGIFMFFFPGPETSHYLLRAIFPLTSDLYWYFSCYIFVCLLAPFLNKILRHSSDTELKQLFWLICGILITVEYIGDSFEFGSGFTSIWLMLLYLLGGILKKTGTSSKIPTYALFLAIVAIDVFYFFLNLKLPFFTVSIFRIGFPVNGSLVNPFYVATAILHVLLFSRFKIHPFWHKIIKFSAAASFSVYIVNTHPLLWELGVNNRFGAWAGSSPVGLLVRVLAFSTCFVTAVVLIDFVRRELFRLLGVQRWPQKVSGLLHKEESL